MAVVRYAWFRFFVLTAVFFHFMNGLLLSISFVNNIALYLLFIHWPPVIAWFNKLPDQLIRFPVMIVATAGLITAYYFYVPITLTDLLRVVGLDDLSASLLVMGLACGFFGLNFLGSLLRRRTVVKT